ncbi:MAG: hypothetical protein LBR23_08575, partial [Spirochaetaceae bacterium]|nr:hypothetical protein [Spirochaetaceae bacterium]
DEKINWIYGIPVKIIEANDPALIREAAILKSAGEMSLADTFLVATAKCTGATLVTADWEELEKVAREGQIPFCWIRPKPAKSLK